MCLVSSATYIANDLADIDRDRAHPVKKNRPLASGAVPKSVAIGLAPILGIGAVAVAFLVNASTVALVVGYALLQVAYNFAFKRVPVADVFAISLGFVLRAIVGAAAIAVGISGWLLFCTGALALLLGFGKRRHELTLAGGESTTRESLRGYSEQTLNSLLVVSAGSAAMCYGVYSIESPTAHRFPALILTSPFVFYGIYRYLYLIFERGEGGEPESLLFGDPHIWVSIVFFVVAAGVAVSGAHVPFLDGFTT